MWFSDLYALKNLQNKALIFYHLQKKSKDFTKPVLHSDLIN